MRRGELAVAGDDDGERCRGLRPRWLAKLDDGVGRLGVGVVGDDAMA
jgi:hypothetical protein